jgi:cardiolipin synthase
MQLLRLDPETVKRNRDRQPTGRLSLLVRTVIALLATLIGLQAAIIAVLAVVARQRKQRTPPPGFPHLDLPEITVEDDQLQIYSYGRDLFQAMLEAIDGARETIYLETYIWKGDAVGKLFKEKLIAKAAEGVQVYITFDVFGNLVVPTEFKHFPSSIHTLRYWPIRRPWHLLDPRRYALDHRKLLIVDGRIAFIGGYNIGQLYATEWRDTHLRIVGPDAMDLAQSFVDFWNRLGPRHDRIMSYYPRRFDPTIQVRGNEVARLIFPIRDMYIDAVDRAQHYILLTNAYFIPDHFLLEALEAAAQRGVDVEVLVPWTSNHIVADWVSRGYFSRCLDAGIRLWGYRHAMIHAKTCTVDGQWSTIGTANLDRLSSVGNYEINAEIYSEELAEQMEQLFESDKTNAFEITPEYWHIHPWYATLSERLLKPLRFLL